MMTVDILAFGAHPDDVEIGMGATIASHVKKSMRVIIVDLTLGDLSSNGDIKIRQKEAEQAGSVLSVSRRINLGFKDRRLENALPITETLVDILRKYRPKVVAAPFYKDRHPDHEQCGRLVREAVFNAGLAKYCPETMAHRINSLVYYFVNDVSEPSFIIDVSQVYSTKMKALNCFRSQFLSSSEGISTPVNNGFLERVQARDRYLGSLCGFNFGEGFVTTDKWIVKDITRLKDV